MNGYNVRIANVSKELSAKERVKIKDTSNAISLDELTLKEGKVIIDVNMWAELAVHNEMSENTDYVVFVIVDKSGNKYATSSPSFISTFRDIDDEMLDAFGGEEDTSYEIEVYRKESKNYKGKEFITCSII